MTPLVSIVMCCYNGEQHIRETIESVLGQSYESFEFIIWNDGSTDNTEFIIKKYTDSRIKYFYHENTGLGKALNLACCEAKGKYIARIDADDICMPERLAEQVDFMESHSNVALVSCFAEYIDDEGAFLGYGIPYTSPRIIKKHLNGIFHPGVMMRNEVYRESGGYPPLKRSQDLFLWHRINQLGDIRIIKRPLIKYRISNNAISSKASQYYLENVSDLWRIFASKPNLNDADYDYLNQFIKDCTLETAIRKSPVNQSETKILRALQAVLPENWSFRIIGGAKNLYGLLASK